MTRSWHAGGMEANRHPEDRNVDCSSAAVNGSSSPPTLIVMAIVNRTPDSFFDRGATFAEDAALQAVDAAVGRGRGHRRHRRCQGRPRRRGGRGRGAPPDRRARRRPSGAAPGAGDQRRHLAGRGRRGLAAGADLLNDTWGGVDPELAEVAAEFGAGLVCAHAGGLAPRTRPHRVGYADVVADVVRTSTGWPTGRSRWESAGRDPDRPGARLRQEHLALAGGHPPARTSWSRRAGRCWSRCPTRTSSARPGRAGRRAADRHARDHGRLAWLGARVFRAHRYAETRRGARQVPPIRGDRPPAVARRGLA